MKTAIRRDTYGQWQLKCPYLQLKDKKLRPDPYDDTQGLESFKTDIYKQTFYAKISKKDELRESRKQPDIFDGKSPTLVYLYFSF